MDDPLRGLRCVDSPKVEQHLGPFLTDPELDGGLEGKPQGHKGDWPEQVLTFCVPYAPMIWSRDPLKKLQISAVCFRSRNSEAKSGHELHLNVSQQGGVFVEAGNARGN